MKYSKNNIGGKVLESNQELSELKTRLKELVMGDGRPGNFVDVAEIISEFNRSNKSKSDALDAFADEPSEHEK